MLLPREMEMAGLFRFATERAVHATTFSDPLPIHLVLVTALYRTLFVASDHTKEVLLSRFAVACFLSAIDLDL